MPYKKHEIDPIEVLMRNEITLLAILDIYEFSEAKCYTPVFIFSCYGKKNGYWLVTAPIDRLDVVKVEGLKIFVLPHEASKRCGPSLGQNLRNWS